MTTIGKRTLAAVLLGFAIAFFISMLNGRSITQALNYAAIFAVILSFIVAVLSWAIEYAIRKGYPGWLGFLLVFFLNVIGVVILVLLPTRQEA